MIHKNNKYKKKKKKKIYVYIYYFYESTFNPITINKDVVITVININGMKTINHDTIFNPDLHSIFNTKVNTIITKNFIIAVLNDPLNVSNIIWTNEKARYKSAGAHKVFIIYL